MNTARRDARFFRICLTIGSVACAFAIGWVTARSTSAAEEVAPPAYMVVSSKLLKPEAIEAYRAAAGPLARAAGLEILARSTHDQLLTLEGKWPFEEGVTIERFRSMKELKDFWYSEAYQEAKKLREGASQINFIVAVEGIPVPEE